MIRRVCVIAVCVLVGVVLRPVAAAAEPASACALPSRTGWTDEGHATNYGVFARPVGTVRAAVSTGTGPVVVADATPGGGSSAPCTDLDVATFGPGQTYTAPGVRIDVLSRSGETDTVQVRRT